MKYGDKRNYRKIDIWVRGQGYVCSTTWSKTCKDAAYRYAIDHGIDPNLVGANFAKD